MDIKKLNKNMIKSMKEKGYIKKKEYIKAFENIFKHKFIDKLYIMENNEYREYLREEYIKNEKLMQRIYYDKSVVFYIEGNSEVSVSQPSVISAMLELADIKKGDKVLEIGTGSGYSTAIISNIVKEKGFVFTIEINKEIYEYAKRKIEEHKLKNVYITNKDGGFGLKDFMPYDKIILSCSTADIPKYWIEQLKIGGTIIAPLITRGFEVIVKLTKISEDILEGEMYHYVHFHGIKGEFSIISHYFYTRNDFKTLHKVLNNYAIIDDEFTEKIQRLSKKELNDFFLFLSLKCKSSICYYSKDNEKESVKGYGIFLKSSIKSSLAMIINKEVFWWGNNQAMSMLKNYYEDFLKIKPNIKDYSIKVYTSDYPYSKTGNEIIIERKNSITVFIPKF